MSRRLVLLALLAAPLAAESGLIRIGDPGSVFDPSRYDEAHPDSREWAQAGVRGGIPFRNTTPVVGRVAPGEDIQAAIDAAGSAPGVILLGRGQHPLTRRLEMRSGVILRGEDRDGTVIAYDIGRDTGSGLGTCILFRKVERAGLEDLTLQHARVRDLDHAKYHEQWANHPDWPAGDNATVEMSKASDCWVQHCRIIDNVNRPMRVWGGSEHVSLRDNVVDYAVNRGGQGSSYYEIVHARYVLMYNETVRRIRHVCLNGTIDYCVLAYCQFEVDVNWHCIPPMAKSLVTHCHSRASEVGHRWPAFCHYRDPVPDDNLIYMVTPDHADGRVYCTRLPGKPFVVDSGRPPPSTGCLYPVTGRHIPYEVLARASLLEQLAEAERGGDWPAVLRCAGHLLATGDAGEDAARLRDLHGRAAATAEAELTPLLERGDAAKLRAFVARWEQAPCRERAVAAVEEAGGVELAGLRERGDRIKAKDWLAFLDTWQGFAVAEEARLSYEEQAAAGLLVFRQRHEPGNRSWLRGALAFLDEWPRSAAAAELDGELTEVLDPALDRVLALEDRRQRLDQLRDFVRSFAATTTGRRAQAVLTADDGR